MLFLFNDVIFELESRLTAPPGIISRVAGLTLPQIVGLVRDQIALNPDLARTAPDAAAKSALLLSLKQPDLNAVLFIAPKKGCRGQDVSSRFAALDPMILHELKRAQDLGRLTPGLVHAHVWFHAATAEG
jgi:hypothetical protein